MSGLSVTENIRVLEENSKKLNEQITVIQQELIRLEGSIRVFKSLKDLGIEHINLPKDEVTNREVMDKLD
jgi:hypothetical protein